MSVAITALVITKNEEAAIRECLEAVDFCDQVVVVDSSSTDKTAEIAAGMGAEVIVFQWDGKYPKKKQWGMENPSIRHDWVLHLDGDERVSRELAKEIGQVLASNPSERAFDIPLAYHFLGRELRHGHRVYKRSLVHRKYAKFPVIDDLGAPGITEVEGHYQPTVNGSVGRLESKLHHDDPGPFSEWLARHNKYSDWEAYLASNPVMRKEVRESRSSGGRLFDRMPLKPIAFFVYSYLIRRGFLDGRQGLAYALSLAIYYWQISLKTEEIRGGRAGEKP